MSELFASGRIVDVIIVFVFAEALALAIYHRATGRGLRPIGILAMLLPGLCLMLALRQALAGADWSAVAMWLLLALFAHLVDLWRRMRGV